MWWAIVVVVAFALEIALVIAMARSNTARWERDRRAARAVVPPGEHGPLAARAARVRLELVQRAPHPHLPHLPHVHLPPRVVERLTQTRGALHLPRPHLPHLHMPHLPRQRTRPAPEAPDGVDETTGTAP